MGIFKKKSTGLLTEEQKQQIVQAIRQAESRTSGEIRVYMEQKCNSLDPVERAQEIFFGLQMHKTTDRNAVLLYVALKDHQLAIFGDEGIHSKAGHDYWQKLVQHIMQHFNRNDFATGISEYIQKIGEGLHYHFPYDRKNDQNELPDEIVFGNV